MASKSDKHMAYAALVTERKACMACQGLVNPAACCGRYDSDHIGPWSRWQANLDARVLIVGQDWGDVACFERQHGLEQPRNPTNAALMELLRTIGIEIRPPEAEDGHEGAVFLTNAVLCLKRGGLQAQVRAEWFDNCGRRFLKPLIELVCPKVVVCLGERAYRAVAKLYGLPHRPFRAAVMASDGLPLPNGSHLYAVYHCGRRIQNTHRPMEQQLQDWSRIGCLTTPL